MPLNLDSYTPSDSPDTSVSTKKMEQETSFSTELSKGATASIATQRDPNFLRRVSPSGNYTACVDREEPSNPGEQAIQIALSSTVASNSRSRIQPGLSLVTAATYGRSDYTILPDNTPSVHQHLPSTTTSGLDSSQHACKSPMRFEIALAKPGDMRTLAEISRKAFANHPYWSSTVSDVEGYCCLLQQKQKHSDIKFIKATTVDGRIVGWASWRLYKQPLVAGRWLAQGLHLHEGKEREENELMVLWENTFNDAWEKEINVNYHLRLGPLVVDPECQRQGVGKALTEWGHSFADAENVYCTLSSSLAGTKLYESLGYRDYGFPEDRIEDFDRIWYVVNSKDGIQSRWKDWRDREMMRKPNAGMASDTQGKAQSRSLAMRWYGYGKWQ